MSNEILQFCLEKGLLVDKEVLDLFDSESDFESIKIIIEKIKSKTHQNIITKNLFSNNKEQVKQVFSEFPEDKQKKLESLKIKLGLSIEISRESVSSDLPTEKLIKVDEEIFSEDSSVKVLTANRPNEKKLEVKDFVNYFRGRFDEIKKILIEHSTLDNLVSINKISGSGGSFSIIGIVSSKSVTKNKNIILEVEDLTGKIKVLINQNKKDLYKEAENIALDSVLGFRGSGNREIFFVNELIFPEARIFEKKKSPVEEYALFLGDVHYGSKLFLESSFLKFIDYLNGIVPGTEEEVNKIKYLFVVGDLITGVGNYPTQEKDLVVVDLEQQFLGIAELLGKIRKDIKIIISPGNHDCVRLMEPQPVLDIKYAWSLYDMENVFVTPNPSTVNIASKKNFPGFDVLTYHGFSYPYYAGDIPDLVSKDAMNCPEEIMKFLLKQRHLAPTHGSNQYYPFEEDPLIIKEIPDIFVSGHTHKCGINYYNNILVVSTSCWEAMTTYQEKFGNKPDHCKVPMVNLKNNSVRILDFEEVEESEEKKFLR